MNRWLRRHGPAHKHPVSRLALLLVILYLILVLYDYWHNPGHNHFIPGFHPLGISLLRQ